MCHFGAAAWKTTNGSREAHKYTETSSEEQNRWGGAFTYSFVPHLTSVVNRQQQHLDSHLSNLHKCLTLHPGVWTNSGVIPKMKSSPLFAQKDSAIDLSETRTFAVSCFHRVGGLLKELCPHHDHCSVPFVLLPGRFIWRLRAELKDASQFKACQHLWKTIAGDVVIRSGVIYYPMNMLIFSYKYESLTSIVKGGEFMADVKFLFPWSDSFIAWGLWFCKVSKPIKRHIF